MESYEEIRKLEEVIEQGYPILTRFRICNGKALYEQIKTIEGELSKINRRGEIFKQIATMQQILEKSFKLFGFYVVINENEFLRLIDLMYTELPKTLKNSREEYSESYKEIEIPDFLKKDS